MKLSPVQIQNRRRFIQLAYKAGVSHLGSSLSVIDIIEAVYQVKNQDEKFVLSNGHAAGALYVILERHGLLKKADLLALEAHPKREPKIGIDVSTGSLGQGLSIAVGLALAQRDKKVYCSISDGECAEGSVSEALRISVENQLTNLRIIMNANSFAAYRPIELGYLKQMIEGLGWKVKEVNGHDLQQLKDTLRQGDKGMELIMALTKVDQLPFLEGINAHYCKMDKHDYYLARKVW